MLKITLDVWKVMHNYSEIVFHIAKKKNENIRENSTKVILQ